MDQRAKIPGFFLGAYSNLQLSGWLQVFGSSSQFNLVPKWILFLINSLGCDSVPNMDIS